MLLLDFKVLLFVLFSYLINSSIVITHITTDIGYDCSTVCSNIGLQCYDNVIQDMNCEKASYEICSSKSVSDVSGSYHCDVGGCYVDCSSMTYANRGTQYWTCNTQPICHHTVGGSNPNYYSFYQICPCAYIVEDENKVHMYAWQIIGLCLFFGCCALCAVQFLAIIFPNLFPTK